MHKKLYKDAVDSISVNEELRETLKTEAAKKKNKSVFFYRYGAMAACLVIAVGVIGVFSKPEVLPEKHEKIVEPEKLQMSKMSRGMPAAISEEIGNTPHAYSPTEGLDYTDWILPDGLEFTESSENSVIFSNGDRKITVTLLPYRGILDTAGEIEGERIDENSVIVTEGENEYSVYLVCGDKDYKISAQNISGDDIKNFAKSIK